MSHLGPDVYLVETTPIVELRPPQHRPKLTYVDLGAGENASLRTLANKHGVSHEAVRQTLLKQGHRADHLSRNAYRNERIRSMAEQGIPWAKIAAALGLSPSAVRVICEDLPPRRSGRPIQSA